MRRNGIRGQGKDGVAGGNHEFSFGYADLEVLAGKVKAGNTIWFNINGAKKKMNHSQKIHEHSP